MIKKLHWENFSLTAAGAEGLGGYYTVFQDGDMLCARHLNLNRVPHSQEELFSGKSLRGAKGACQRHHNKQVREVLEDLLDFTALRKAANIQRRVGFKGESDYEMGYEDGRVQMACQILLGLEGLK